jgi:hypothetical protein
LLAGKDATQVFFSLHRHEVLLKPHYSRLQIGKVQGQEEAIKAPVPGELSKVPYAEPTWLNDGYYSPYYTNNHRKFQKAVRAFCMEVIHPEAVRCEDNGNRISQEVVDKLRYVQCVHRTPWMLKIWFSTTNIIAMRLGPGKHLIGRSLLGGIVKPEEFDYFHEARMSAFMFFFDADSSTYS